jgi:hypothetical protein
MAREGMVVIELADVSMKGRVIRDKVDIIPNDHSFVGESELRTLRAFGSAVANTGAHRVGGLSLADSVVQAVKIERLGG